MAWNSRKPWNGANKWRGWRRRSPRKISFKALPKTVARKRTDWVSLYNDTGAFDGVSQGCTLRCIEFGGSFCEEPSTRIAIMPAGAIQALYDDDVTIAAMRGFINMKPRWTSPNGCDTNGWALRMAAEQWPIYFKAGLYKQELTDEQGGIPPFVNPNVAQDWTDVSALRKWNHIWQPKGRTTQTWQQPNKLIGTCSQVERASYLTPATASGSQPSFTVPAIDTDCVSVTVGIGEGACNIEQLHFERDEPMWYRMSLNRSKPIRLHENDSLDIFCNWSMPRANDDCETACGASTDGPNPCAMQLAIQLQVKLQFG